MATVVIGMARERNPRDYQLDGGESTLRPRPLMFPVSDPEQIKRLSAASQGELDQYARNMIANYLMGNPSPSIDTNARADFTVERVSFQP